MTYKPVIYISITAAVSPYYNTYTHDIVSYAMAAIVADRHFACHHRNSCDQGVGFNVNTSGIFEKHYNDWMHQMCLKIWSTNDNLVWIYKYDNFIYKFSNRTSVYCYFIQVLVADVSSGNRELALCKSVYSSLSWKLQYQGYSNWTKSKEYWRCQLIKRLKRSDCLQHEG